MARKVPDGQVEFISGWRKRRAAAGVAAQRSQLRRQGEPMRNPLFLVLVVALLFGANAQSDPVEGHSEGSLATCLDEANGDRAAVRACVGAAAWPCIDEGQGATMMRSLCWSGEATWWQGRTEEVAAQLAVRDSERSASLDASTTAFEAFADRECAYRGAAFGGGTGAQPAMAECAAVLWAERYIMLSETLADY